MFSLELLETRTVYTAGWSLRAKLSWRLIDILASDHRRWEYMANKSKCPTVFDVSNIPHQFAISTSDSKRRKYAVQSPVSLALMTSSGVDH